MSGQGEQELGMTLGGKEFGRSMRWQVGREVTGKTRGWKVGGTQDVGRYVYPVWKDRKENDVGEEKDVGNKVDTCAQTVEMFGLVIDGAQF